MCICPSRGGFDKRRRGEEANSGGLRPLLELCFGTSEIECSATWSYIMSTLRQAMLLNYFRHSYTLVDRIVG